MLVSVPRIKPGVRISESHGQLVLQNGSYETRMDLAQSVRVRPDVLAAPGEDLLEGLKDCFHLDDAGAASLVDVLTTYGLVIESEEQSAYDGAYVAHRLIDYFRALLDELLRRNPLVALLRAGASEDLERGIMLETYHMIRNAAWTAPPVLSRSLTPLQRELLVEFFNEEGGHSGLIEKALEQFGVPGPELRLTEPIPETVGYNLCFYAAGNMSPAHFAASIIVPEVRQYPDGTRASTGGTDILSLMAKTPKAALDQVRLHEDIDGEEDHSGLPVTLLSEEGPIRRDVALDLVRTVRQTTHGLDHWLAGIARRYGYQETAQWGRSALESVM